MQSPALKRSKQDFRDHAQTKGSQREESELRNTACYYPDVPVKPCDSFGQLISNIPIITEINTGYSRTERREKNFFCKLEVALFIRELPTILQCSVSATKLHSEKGLL